MANLTYAETLVDLYNRMKGRRQNWETQWQSLHDYFYIESEDITSKQAEGTRLNANYIYDATTLDAADVLASGFMNYLTPPTSRWMRLTHRDPKLQMNKNVSDYLEDVTDVVHQTLNQSNFYNQMYSTYKASGVYGTSFLYQEEDINDGVRFYSMPCQQCIIVDNAAQRPDKFFIEFEYYPSQAAGKFGLENLSTKLQEEMGKDNGQGADSKKHKFLLYIAQRSVRDVTKSDKGNLPIEAVWIELDAKKIVDESGYHEMPVMAHRFDKRPFVEWGYGPAWKALPFARTLAAIAKTNLRMMMKHTDPPQAIPNNAFVMPFNQNPRAVNYYDPSKMKGGQKDIFSFGNDGDPVAGMNMLEYYTGQVSKMMYNDVFLAFNQLTKQMNNPEVAERIAEKMTILGPSVGRFISDMISPTVIRTVSILYRTGRIGEPPAEMLENPSYDVVATSQLAQAQKRSELNALLTGLQIAGQVAQFKPELLDRINGDRVLKEAWNIVGSPSTVLNSDDEVEAIREARALIAQQQQQMNLAQQGADVVEKGSKADMNVSKSQEAVNV